MEEEVTLLPWNEASKYSKLELLGLIKSSCKPESVMPVHLRSKYFILVREEE